MRAAWCIAALLAAAPAPAQSLLDSTSLVSRHLPADAALRTAAFDRVWTLIRDRYHSAGLNGIDWNGVRDRYRPALDTVTTVGGLYDVLTAMTGELGDGHTRVHDPLRTAARRQRMAITTGVSVIPVEGAPVIAAVADTLRTSGVPLAAGMRVLSVDDVPADSLFAARVGWANRTALPHSTAYLTWARLLEGPTGLPLRLRVEDTLGVSSEVVLERRMIPSVPRVTGRVTGDSVLVLQWDGFRPGIADSVAAWLRRHPTARGVVLDLRMNGGGSAEETGRVAGLFVNERIVTAQYTRRGRRWFGLRANRGEWRAGRPGGQVYAGPVAILTSPRSASGAELLASALQEHGRAAVVGERTCGCLLGINRYESLPGGGEIAISETGLRSGRHGRRVEGEGVLPDITVTPTRMEVARGDDPALRAATEVFFRPPPVH